MNWLPALDPWQWGLLGCVPIGIILLYFLKLRREPVEVPSTYLWQQTIEDLHVNSLLQRLRRSILLFLQLLAVALAALALLRPGFLGTDSTEGRYVFLLDSSASMNATDLDGGVTRFAKAKELIGQRIAAMSDRDVAMLVTFSDRAEVLQSFTADRGRLREALQRAESTNRSTDIMSALRAADGLANPKRTSEAGTNDYQVADAMPADLLIFSDGNFQTPTVLEIEPSTSISPELVESWLLDVGYESVASVTTRGRYNRSGNLLTVFSPLENEPSEIRWDGDGLVDRVRGVIRKQTGNSADVGTELPSITYEERLEVKLGSVDAQANQLADFSLGNLTPEYIPVGSAEVDNLGITTFYAERNAENPSEIQAFATITNCGTSSRLANAVLTIDGVLQEAASVDLERGEKAGLSFAMNYDDSVSMKLTLEESSGRALADDFSADNIAYAGLSPMKTVSVLVITPGNRALEIGLKTEKTQRICITEFQSPGYLESEAYAKRASAGVDDLIIYDRCAPAEMPTTNTFSIGSIPNDTWQWDSDPGSMVPIDLNRTHPLMRFVELYSLLIFEGRAIKGPEGMIELASADTGSFLGVAPRDGHQDLVLGFPIVSTDDEGNNQTNTNWYAERSWPVFLYNVARYLAGAAEESGAPSYRPGSTVQFRVENALGDIEMSKNGEQKRTVSPDSTGSVEIVDTNEIGNYQFVANDQLVNLFAVNLFDASESKIAVSPAVEIGYETVDAQATGIESRQEYWRVLLLLVLVILGIEWYYYSRRIA